MSFPVDANGVPRGHDRALWRASQELADWQNELPDGIYHAGPTDCESGAERVVAGYLHELRQMQEDQ